MIKAVIFDVDNTLYSYTKAHEAAFQALTAYAEKELGLSADMFERLHKEAERELKAYMGEAAAFHNRCIRYQTILERRGLPLSPHVLAMYDLYWGTLLAASVPSDGAVEVLRKLKERGVCLGVGTDMTARMQFKKLERLGLLPYMDFLVSSEEAGVEKPAEAFFARCAEKADCRRTECLFVGDSLEKDVRGALNAGLHAVWYRPQGLCAQETAPQITALMQLLRFAEAL